MLLDGDHGACRSGLEVGAGIGVAEDMHGAVVLIDKSLPKRRAGAVGDRVLIIVIFIHKCRHADFRAVRILGHTVSHIAIVEIACVDYR